MQNGILAGDLIPVSRNLLCFYRYAYHQILRLWGPIKHMILLAVSKEFISGKQWHEIEPRSCVIICWPSNASFYNVRYPKFTNLGILFHVVPHTLQEKTVG